MKRAKFKPRPFLVLKIPYFCRPNYRARVAELVDALDSKSSSFGSAGSIPASGTREETFSRESPFLIFNNHCRFEMPLNLDGVTSFG